MRAAARRCWPWLLLTGLPACGESASSDDGPVHDAAAFDAAPHDGATLGDAALDGDGGALPVPTDEHLTDTSQAPDAVYFRTNLRSFNSRYYALIAGREIYLRSNSERTGLQSEWTRIANLPAELAGDVQGIALDDRFLMAVNSARKLWEMDGARGDAPGFVWKEYRGLPFALGEQNYLPEGSPKWDKSVASPEEDENYTDPVGHLFKVGKDTCAHVFVLRGGGQQIGFNDAWLPADLSSEICGPKRGRFVARALSASGSTLAVMNQHGDLFTRRWDFDLGGSNTVFWKYSYYDQTSVAVPVVQLPGATWVQQPKIDGRITDTLSIHKIDRNLVHRILRVEGLDAQGHAGFYERDTAAPPTDGWAFHVTSLPIVGHFLDNPAADTSDQDLGALEDLAFSWNLGQLPQLGPAVPLLGLAPSDFAAEIADFNCYCSPSTLRVHLTATDHLDLVLHSTEAVRLGAVQTRGLTDQPRSRNGALEVPRSVLDNLAALSPKARAFITQYLAGKQFTDVSVQAATHSVQLDGGPIHWQFAR